MAVVVAVSSSLFLYMHTPSILQSMFSFHTCFFVHSLYSFRGLFFRYIVAAWLVIFWYIICLFFFCCCFCSFPGWSCIDVIPNSELVKIKQLTLEISNAQNFLFYFVQCSFAVAASSLCLAMLSLSGLSAFVSLLFSSLYFYCVFQFGRFEMNWWALIVDSTSHIEK